MRHLDLFSGIGGFALAARQVWGQDHEVAAFCEIDPDCRGWLRKHWPDVMIINDIRDLKGGDYGPVDLLTGGFPCQPFSAAGKRAGATDDRYLWPEMLRIISEAKPTWIIGENVDGITSMALERMPAKVASRTTARHQDQDIYRGIFSRQENMLLDHICKELEEIDYEVQPVVVPACAVNAPHRRDRVWIVAHSGCEHAQRQRGSGDVHCEAIAAQGKRDQWQRRGSSSSDNGKGNGCALVNAQGIGRGEGIPEPKIRRGRNSSSCAGCTDGCALADSDRERRQGEFGQNQGKREGQNQFGQRSEALADSKGSSERPRFCQGKQRTERWKRSGDRGCSGEYVADSQHGRCIQGAQDSGRQTGSPAHRLRESDMGSMGNASGQGSPVREGRQGNPGQELPAVERTGLRDPWGDSEWMPGRDGKSRRIKPGIRLLAHGIPNRVARLRGLGNAIVPWVAVQFFLAIKQVMGAENEH